MTASAIADSIVNLCGAIGLSVAMLTLYRRDPRSPLTRRLLVALGIIALLFLVRGTAWWSGSGVLDNLSMIPAALIPLGALIVTEGILRRLIPLRCRCSSSRDLPPARGCWRRATAARCWRRKTAASGVSLSAPFSSFPSSSPISGC